jgi:hypothetical protein
MLDSPESVCAGQIGFQYPSTFVRFSMLASDHAEALAGSGVVLEAMPGHHTNGYSPGSRQAPTKYTGMAQLESNQDPSLRGPSS